MKRTKRDQAKKQAEAAVTRCVAQALQAMGGLVALGGVLAFVLAQGVKKPAVKPTQRDWAALARIQKDLKRWKPGKGTP
jgi:hypothetical protein